MQVRLTEKGRKALDWSPDRLVANVSDQRAYVMMENGMANPDKGFMALFDGPLPEEAKPEVKEEKKPEVKVVAKKEEVKKPKKEKADSKKFGKRSKAVKY